MPLAATEESDMTTIVACIDASQYANGVCDLAAWVARSGTAKLEILHVVQRVDSIAARNDLSGAIGPDDGTELLEELTRFDELQAKLMVQRGRALLETAEARARAAGVNDVTTVHRHGGIVETILECEAQADWVVLGKRGASGQYAPRHLGSKFERVVRSSDKPIWVAPAELTTIDSVVIAFDGGPASQRAVALVASSPEFSGLKARLVMVGAAKSSSTVSIDDAAAVLQHADRFGGSSVIEGDPEQVIPEYMNQAGAGVLVMGAYSHSRLKTFVFGSTTAALVRAVAQPMLLVR
jgi:nucleotide-binding universal stress UspA family protein